MISEVYLPTPIADKFKNQFLKSTLKIGEQASFKGYFLSFPLEPRFRKLLWPKLSPQIGNFKVKMITPFPENGFPVLPVVVPQWLNYRIKLAEVSGYIYDLSLFTSEHGRFLLANEINKLKFDEYMSIEKSGLTPATLQQIFDFTFPEMAKDVMLTYFLSSPKYIQRSGGNTVSFLRTNSKHYSSNFTPIFETIDQVSNIIKKESFTVSFRYDDDIRASVKPSFKLRYSILNPKKAGIFYKSRVAKTWELSAMTPANLKMTDLIKYSELPYLPTKEEMQINDLNLIAEYSADIGFYALQKHIEEPEIELEEMIRFKSKIIRSIEKEFPDMIEAMKFGIIMDIGDVNGFGEHMARIMNSWKRANEDPVNSTINLYIRTFERVDDVLGTKIRRELASEDLKKKREKIINRVLWELNVLKPTGWDYEYFEMKMRERGIEDNLDKLISSLLRDGIIIEKRRGLYYAVANV